MYKLPPLNALKVFETVARYGSVKKAAEELYVTSPAISHQLSNLEEFLGAKLFVRNGKSLVLSEVAQDYLTEVRPCLEAIGRATLVATHRQVRDVINVSAPPTLTSSWLIPRLQSFMQLHPQYDVRFLDRMTVSANDRNIDLAIEYRYEPNPGLISKQILGDDIVMLVSPEFQKRHQLRCFDDLQGVPLIETERRLTSWKTLLSDYKWINKQQLISVGYSLHAFEAAALGVGVAIGNRANVENLLKAQRLVVPFELPDEYTLATPSYFLSIHHDRQGVDKVDAFNSWLLEQIKDFSWQDA